MRKIASRLRSTSASVVAHEETLMRMAVTPLPQRRAAPAGAVLLNARDHPPGGFRRAERHQHLVQDHVIQNLEAGARQGRRQTASRSGSCGRSTLPVRCVPATSGRPIYPRRGRAAKVRGQNSAVRDGRPAAGRRAVRLIAPRELAGIADEGQAAVIRNIEPLVGVGGPGIGIGHSRHQVGMTRAGRGPQSERSVHVDPGACRMRAAADLRHRIERPGIHVAGLHAHDARSAPTPEARRQACAPRRPPVHARHVRVPSRACPATLMTEGCASSLTTT